MSDRFYRIPIDRLFKWITAEEKEGRIFGLYKELFFTPSENDAFRMNRYGRVLETPIGVAAGPQTQLAHNIIASWLCGARYIELKTVQTLDEIEVTKPCIDMEDEGYNCEWSQELKVRDSFDEYLNAWILIHLLKHKFGWNDNKHGFIFNISIGYNLEGILKPNVQWFLDKINNCKDELEEKIERLVPLYPGIKNLNIPYHISDNVTLSTMHGCPPDEIEKIGKYLIEKRKLHTTIKLNPTLLGPEKVRYILNEKLGYEITVPDEAFEHDLKYDEALLMINSLTEAAANNNVRFGLKLTNTLESLNSTRWLPKDEKMVYTSGRALHPISINLAAKLQSDFNGTLDISFSAGVDAFNVSDTLACNLKPITVCSDLLKPGGYLRLTQYLKMLSESISTENADSLDNFIIAKAKTDSDVDSAGLTNLKNYAEAVLENKVYHKSSFPYDNIKTNRKLTEYDCIHSPCIEACAISQNVPDYMYYTSRGEFEEAYKVILKDNPLPNMTGSVCDHLCQTKCTRMNYDNPLLIREIKKFIADKFDGKEKINITKNGLSAAVIGAGPAGLTCAYFLALDGFDVEVYESKPFAGGMVSGLIPYFRLSDKSIESDINLFKSLGVEFHFEQEVDKNLFESIRKEKDFIYIGVGAQKNKKLNVPGENLDGIYNQLTFLSKVRAGEKFYIGSNVAIIGGGLSAVDAARTAKRLVGSSGKVTMIYRRTKNEMPVGDEEIKALLDEGVELLELSTPVSFSKKGNKVIATCIKMKLGKPDESGRRRPVPIDGSEFNIEFDSVIISIGQELDLSFFPEKELKVNPETLETQLPDVFAGGDAIRGADSLINAMGDGKKAAQIIIQRASKKHNGQNNPTAHKLSMVEYQRKQSYRKFGVPLPEIPLSERESFQLVHPVLDDKTAMEEAERCLFCDDVCNICVGVCPNFSNVTFTAEPIDVPVWKAAKQEDKIVTEKIDVLSFRQSNQIFNIGDFCNECGNCDTFCPTSGAPYKTKPHFYLTEESFNSEEIGYYLFKNTLKFKSNGKIESLSLIDENLTYESDEVVAKFSVEDFSLINVEFKTGSLNKIKFEKAAEMYYLFYSLKDFSVFKF